MSAFFQHLSSLQPSIEFTIEIEKKGSLSFLDTMTKHNYRGRMVIIVQRKPSHTDHYLQYYSHHLNYLEKGMDSGLFHRNRGCKMTSCFQDPLIPYLLDLGEDLRKVCRRHSFKTPCTLHHLCKIKDRDCFQDILNGVRAPLYVAVGTVHT